MEVKTIKIFSLCKDFNPDNGFKDMYEKLSNENACDVYIEYNAYTKETLKKEGYDNDLIANRLVELGAEDKELVFIHMDY